MTRLQLLEALNRIVNVAGLDSSAKDLGTASIVFLRLWWLRDALDGILSANPSRPHLLQEPMAAAMGVE